MAAIYTSKFKWAWRAQFLSHTLQILEINQSFEAVKMVLLTIPSQNLFQFLIQKKWQRVLPPSIKTSMTTLTHNLGHSICLGFIQMVQQTNIVHICRQIRQKKPVPSMQFYSSLSSKLPTTYLFIFIRPCNGFKKDKLITISIFVRLQYKIVAVQLTHNLKGHSFCLYMQAVL